MGYELDWSILWQLPYRTWILEGISLTIVISLVSWVFALIIGILIGLMRESPLRIIRLLSTAYVEIHRNIPLLVQLFFGYFALPMLLPIGIRRSLYDIGWEMGSAVLVLSLYTSAKVAEHVRAGLKTVSNLVKSGALATGLSWWQTQIYVVGPLLLRVIVPSLTTEFLTIFKGSSLAMTVGVVETTYVTQRLGFQTFRWIEANTVGTLVYLGCAWAIALFMAAIESRTRIPGLLQRGETG
ncbi:MAG: amino acid ABC transporter permease [Deltaproteobacteria bacterium]|nr:amino acid ABC transporter permease [Deltaproteobacteria bacterium]